MENIGSTYYFMAFPLQPLTWHAGTFINGVQHVAAAVVLTRVALAQMGADFYLTVDTCRQQSYVQQSINTKTTDEQLVLSLCLINHLSCSHMAQCRYSSTHYYVKVDSFMPWQLYSWCPLDRGARTSLDVVNNRQIYICDKNWTTSHWSSSLLARYYTG